jgi:alkyldihydroxyacetonephosphate synthase
MTPINFIPLIAILGSDQIRTDEEARRKTLPGWSLNVSKQHRTDPEDLPSAVLFPSNVEEVLAIVEWAEQQQLAIYPVGGSSSLRKADVNGSFIAVDVHRIDQLFWDAESLLVTAGAGKRLGEVEAELNRHQYTLGHFPQTLQQMTVGGAVATNAIGLLSGKYGRQRDLTAGLEVVVPGFGVLRTADAPGAFAYHDLHDLFIGSEGALGIVTQATLRMRPLPEVRAFAVFSFSDFDTAVDAARLIYRSDARPAALRILDRTSAENLLSTQALLIMAFEGDELVQTGNYQLAHAVCQQVGGTPEATEIGDTWFENRQNITWISRNIQPTILIDVIAVSGVWSKIKLIEKAAREAISSLTTKLSLELCHPTANGAALEIRFEVAVPSPNPETVNSLHQQVLYTLLMASKREGAVLAHHYGIGNSIIRDMAVNDPETAFWEKIKQRKDHLDR